MRKYANRSKQSRLKKGGNKIERKTKTIKVAESAGFCPGVKRAVEMLEEALEKGGKVYLLGEIIHNAPFNEEMKSRGVKYITAGEIDSVPDDGIIFIRTHGEEKHLYEKLAAGRHKYIDSTCPYVKRIHRLVAAKDKNTLCIVLGDENHPEVKGIMSFAPGECRAASGPEEALEAAEAAKRAGKSVCAVSQTTYDTTLWKFFANNFKILYTKEEISDTICTVTETRQSEAERLAASADLTVVVGGKKSSNTQKLYDIAGKNCRNVIFIERPDELEAYLDIIQAHDNIALLAGASTPDSIIREVKATMAENANNELSFEELLEKSFKTLNIGERVKGTILAVTPAEIKVDLGTKHTGILPIDELSADGNDNIDMNSFQVGDPIEAVCTKFSDLEGTVILSKKRLDESKNTIKIAEAYESGEILHGVVRDVVKGGVIVMISGVRVFIPAGQCGRDTSNLESLKNTEVPVKLIDFNALRKKVVGSIRIAKKIERKAKLDEFYESLEIGQKLTGTVRSVTNYGAFVNIGPTDGMIHVSEMFWGRPRNPAELFKPGDSVDVYIKDKDRENERISLGYKTEDTNPWKIFSDKYKVDDIVNVSIVSIMPFGAFAEIVPGVDGLIHCSQIGHRFVANPASVLKVGQSVNVKITAIDDEKNRVSLSIKALLGPEEATPEEMESAGVIIAAEEEEKEKEPAEVEIADIVEEVETETVATETAETEAAETEVEEAKTVETEVAKTEVEETEVEETEVAETEETEVTVEAEATKSEAEQQQPEEVLENPEKPDETDAGAEEQPENQNED